jgi:hypothetical protein
MVSQERESSRIQRSKSTTSKSRSRNREEAIAASAAKGRDAEQPALDEMKYGTWWEEELHLTPDEELVVNPWLVHKLKGDIHDDGSLSNWWYGSIPTLGADVTFSVTLNKKFVQCTLPNISFKDTVLRSLGPFCVVKLPHVRAHYYPYHWGTYKDVKMAAETVLGDCLSKVDFDNRQLAPKIESVISKRKEMWPFMREEVNEFLMTPEFANMVSVHYKRRNKQAPAVINSYANRKEANSSNRKYNWGFVMRELVLINVLFASSVFLHPLLLVVWLFVFGRSAIQLVQWYKKNTGEFQPKFLTVTQLCLPKRCSHGADLPELDENTQITLPKNSEKCLTTKHVKSWGVLLERVSLVVPLGCAHDIYNGLRIRFVYKREVDSCVIQSIIDNFLPHLTNGIAQEISEDEWIRNLPNRRARIMRDAVGRIGSDTIDSDIFVKNEAYVGKGEVFKPRIIWCRKPEFQKEIGSYFYSMSKYYCTMFNVNSNMCLDSGLTADQVAYRALEASKFKHLFEIDVSNWDGSIASPWYKLEKELINYYPCPRDNKLLFKFWNKMVAASRPGIRVETKHGRRSGDLWTSLFNGIINIAIMLYIFGSEAEGTARGDDNFVGTNKDISATQIIEIYASFGMKAKVFERNLNTLGYCSGRIWATDYGYKWGVDPFRVLSKLFLNINNRPERERKGIIKGTCISLLPIANHVPFIGTLISNIDKELHNEIPRFIDEDLRYKIGADVVTPCSERAKSQCMNLYRLTEEQFNHIEQTYASIRLVDMPLIIYDEFINEVAVTSLDADLPAPNWYNCEKLKPMIVQNPWHDLLPHTTLLKTNLLLLVMVTIEMFLNDNKMRILLAIVYLMTSPSETRNLNKPFYKDSYYYYLCFLAPIIEEICKQYVTGFLWFVILIEGYYLGPPNVAMHFGLSYSPYEHRILLHIFWNHLVWAKTGGPINPGCLTQLIAWQPSYIPVKRKINTKKSRKNTSIKPLIKQALLELGSGIGAVGSSSMGLPSALGAGLGRKAASYVSRVIGTGDYKVGSNSLLSGSGPPIFSAGKRSTIISHREPLGDISGSVAFAKREYNINPGDSITFPWLSGVAQNYSQYKIHGMIFTFESRSAEALNSTNTALGTLLIATQYNVNERAYSNKQEMENSVFSTATKPSNSAMHPIECDPQEKVLELMYVRTPDQSGTEDPRFYDLGTVTVATVGMQAAAIIGEIWVTYEIEFFKPILIPGGYNSPLWAHQAITAPTNINPLGPVIAANTGNMSLTVSAVGAGFDTVSFPTTLSNGTFLFVMGWKGSSTAALGFATAYTNATPLFAWYNNGADSSNNVGSTHTQFLYCGLLRINNTGAKFTFSAITLPTSGTYGDIFFAQVGEGVGRSLEKSQSPEEFVEVMHMHELRQHLPVRYH